MIAILGETLAILGAIMYFVVIWRSSDGMNVPKRIIMGSLGMIEVMYPALLWFMAQISLHGQQMSLANIAVLFMGITYLSVDIGKSLPAAKIMKILQKEPKSFSFAIVDSMVYDANMIYVLLVSILGITIIQDTNISSQEILAALMYVSIGATSTALITGVVIHRFYENINNLESLKKIHKRIISACAGIGLIAIIGLLLAINILQPYLK